MFQTKLFVGPILPRSSGNEFAQIMNRRWLALTAPAIISHYQKNLMIKITLKSA